MRPLLMLVLLLLAACTEATATRVDDRTFLIQGPSLSVSAEGPNRRMAEQLCPGGYRVLESQNLRGVGIVPSDIVTTWAVRCL